MSSTGAYLVGRVRIAVKSVSAFAECVQASILPVFSGIEASATEIANAEWDRLGASSAGEDDMSEIADAAQEAGQEFYDNMMAVRQATLNLFAAGLFHLIEQQLASMCQDMATRSDKAPPSDTKIDVVADWFAEHLGVDLRGLTHWAKIDELRYLANVVKHGEGTSAKKLRELNPRLFEHPAYGSIFSEGWISPLPLGSPLAGEDLYVNEESFKGYELAGRGLLCELIGHFEAH